MLMKQALKLKRTLPERQWRRLSSVVQTLVSIAIQPIVLFAKVWPDVVLIEVKQRLGIVRRIDYERHEIFINVDSLTEYSSRLHSCKKEPETVEWIETLFEEGDVFFDVGANVGAYSLIACKFHGGAVKVYAFEPAFPTFVQLSKNIILNGCDEGIVPLQIALSERTGLETLNYHNVSPGGSLHALGESADNRGDVFEPVARQPVLAYRIDDLVEQFPIPAPNHMKIDVDGTELQILKGADHTVSSPLLRSIIVELEEGHQDRDQVVEFLSKRGLTLASRHRYLYGDEAGPSSRVYNYIFHRLATCTCPECSKTVAVDSR